MELSGDPLWLEDTLRAGLGQRLRVMDGWRESGTGGQMGRIWGVMIHHTGSRTETNARIRTGRPDLADPLSPMLDPARPHLLAHRRRPLQPRRRRSLPRNTDERRQSSTNRLRVRLAPHPPDGSYDPHKRWPDAQIITMRDATAAVLQHLGHGPDRVIGHRAYATLYPNIKWDPGNLDMDWFSSRQGPGRTVSDINRSSTAMLRFPANMTAVVSEPMRRSVCHVFYVYHRSRCISLAAPQLHRATRELLSCSQIIRI